MQKLSLVKYLITGTFTPYVPKVSVGIMGAESTLNTHLILCTDYENSPIGCILYIL